MKAHRQYLWWLAAPAAAWTVLLLADAPKSDPTVVTRTTSSVAGPSRRSVASVPAQSQGGATPTSTCSGLAPGPDWVCQNGTWQFDPNAASTSGTASTTGAPTGAGGAGNCLGVQPGAGYTCMNGAWTAPNSTPTQTTTPNANVTTSNTCVGTPPVSNWSCQYGVWTPPNTSMMGQQSQGGCAGPQPGSGWTCQNGVWLVGPSPSTSTPSGTVITSPSNSAGSPSVNGTGPGPTATQPGSAGSAGVTPAGQASCTTPSPGGNFVCQNGAWVAR